MSYCTRNFKENIFSVFGINKINEISRSVIKNIEKNNENVRKITFAKIFC